MRNVLWRLVIWVAETLDRSLLTVPEVDEYYPPTVGRREPEIELTRPIIRDLIAARAGEAPGFVQE